MTLSHSVQLCLLATVLVAGCIAQSLGSELPSSYDAHQITDGLPSLSEKPLLPADRRLKQFSGLPSARGARYGPAGPFAPNIYSRQFALQQSGLALSYNNQFASLVNQWVTYTGLPPEYLYNRKPIPFPLSVQQAQLVLSFRNQFEGVRLSIENQQASLFYAYG